MGQGPMALAGFGVEPQNVPMKGLYALEASTAVAVPVLLHPLLQQPKMGQGPIALAGFGVEPQNVPHPKTERGFA